MEKRRILGAWDTNLSFLKQLLYLVLTLVCPRVVSTVTITCRMPNTGGHTRVSYICQYTRQNFNFYLADDGNVMASI